MAEHRADVHKRRDVESVHEEEVATVPGDRSGAQLVGCEYNKWSLGDLIEEGEHKSMPILRCPNNDPFQMFSTLMDSCFCRTCLHEMAQKIPSFGGNNYRKIKRLQNENEQITDGIDFIAIDDQLTHLSASIVGPPGSPYEGGKFFLYIVLPQFYPMFPPTVRFLTKIVHPNVSRHGDVGIDIIQHNWSLALTIPKILLSVQSLLTDPFTEVGKG